MYVFIHHILTLLESNSLHFCRVDSLDECRCDYLYQLQFSLKNTIVQQGPLSQNVVSYYVQLLNSVVPGDHDKVYITPRGISSIFLCISTPPLRLHLCAIQLKIHPLDPEIFTSLSPKLRLQQP